MTQEKQQSNIPFTDDYDDLSNKVNKAIPNGVVIVGCAIENDVDDSSATLVYELLRDEISKIYKDRKDVFLIEMYVDDSDMQERMNVCSDLPTFLFYSKKSTSIADPVMRYIFKADQASLFRYIIHDFILKNTNYPKPYKYQDIDNAKELAEVPFQSVERPIFNDYTQREVGKEHVVIINNKVIIELLRRYGHSHVHKNEISFYNLENESTVLNIPKFSNTYPIAPLLHFIEESTKVERELAKKMISEGQITFNHLRYLFKIGDEIVKTKPSRKQGGRIKSIGTKDTTRFSFTIEVVASNGDKFFSKARDLTKLSYHHITPQEKEELTSRGRKFRQIGVQAHLQFLNGFMFLAGLYSKKQVNAVGRVMIDSLSYYKINSSRSRPSYNHEIQELTDDLLWIAAPCVLGFSFTLKQWGKIPVELLQQVEFEDTAFEKLVLPQAQKMLISSLVTNKGDIIKGKGAGCIFLLHGPPGTGKTLTAEAVSEMLHKPLYNISVGELGVTTTELEDKLKNILELAAAWDAVILLDEADIFLEARTMQDIKRNAMVGVFLRVLEYHNGVLFMTSNRVKCFDEAFHSRVSVSIKYTRFTDDSRSQIWHNLLYAAKIPHYYNNEPFLNPTSTEINANKFGVHELNGRQIRTTVRLAQTLAVSESQPLTGITEEHVLMCIELAMQFVQQTSDMSNPMDIDDSLVNEDA